jgi:hypothetical protein
MEAIGDCSITNLKNISTKKKLYSGRKFEILQNIQDRSTLEKHVKRARDPISITTKNEKPNETNGTQNQIPRRKGDFRQLEPIGAKDTELLHTWTK